MDHGRFPTTSDARFFVKKSADEAFAPTIQEMENRPAEKCSFFRLPSAAMNFTGLKISAMIPVKTRC